MLEAPSINHSLRVFTYSRTWGFPNAASLFPSDWVTILVAKTLPQIFLNVGDCLVIFKLLKYEIPALSLTGKDTGKDTGKKTGDKSKSKSKGGSKGTQPRFKVGGWESNAVYHWKTKTYTDGKTKPEIV